MANSVTITWRDGTQTKFEDRGRPGGSYEQKVKFEGGVVSVIDCYGASKSYPLDLIQEVKQWPGY